MHTSKISTILPAINLSDRQRIASLTIGTALVVNAMLTGKRFRLIKGIAGAALLARGITGYCPSNATTNRHSTKSGLSAVNIRTSVTVNQERQKVYNFWKRVENLPFVLTHIDSVTRIDDKTSEWKLKVPGDLADISWTAEIVKDEPDKLIGWQSVEGSALQNAGKVEFTDAGDGQTTIDVIITYHPPLGIVGNSVARLFTPAFRKLVADDIKKFKQNAENADFQQWFTEV